MISNQQKFQIIEREFLAQDIHLRDTLTEEQLTEVLRQKAYGELDSSILEQLFDRIESVGGKIMVQDFIKTFIEAEEILQSRIENHTNSLEDNERQKHELLNKIQQTDQNEPLNQFGIMHNSKLTLEFLKYQNDHPLPQNTQIVGKISCGQQVFETKMAHCFSNQGFDFNETCHFDIETGMENVNIQILQIQLDNTQTIGQIMVPLNLLKDQNQHEQVLQVYGKEGNLTSGKVLVKLQWIYSQNKYLQEKYQVCNKQVQRLIEDKQYYEQNLLQLRNIFPVLSQKYMAVQNNINQQNQSNFNLNPSAHQTPLKNSNVPYQSGFQQEYNKAEVKALKIQNVRSLEEEYDYFNRLLINVLLLLSLLICLFKTQYLDLMLCFFFIKHYQGREINERTIPNYLKMFLFSSVLEFIWLLVVGANWWDLKNFESSLFEEENVRRFIVVICWISLALKIIIVIYQKLLLDQMVNKHQKKEYDAFQDPYLYEKSYKSPESQNHQPQQIQSYQNQQQLQAQTYYSNL